MTRTKPLRCRAPGCREPATGWSALYAWCTPEHGALVALRAAEKLRRAAAREGRRTRAVARVKLKTRRELLSEAQAAVNRYVRARDAGKPCISCGRGPNWGGQWHASHFRSVGAASAVRFHLWNVHRACSICNHHKSGNLAEYEPRLRALIGDAKVDWLRMQNHRVSYERSYLLRLKSVFAKKARRTEARARCGLSF